MSPARPQVVAHRGASETEPEHTLAAYRNAIRSGADALECDVRLTSDGHLVCVHDRLVDRTSDGSGRVSTLELAELEGMDWGSWKLFEAERGQGLEVPDVVERSDRAHLLTLRRLFGEVAGAGRPVQVAVETKHPTRWGGLAERRLVQLLREFGWAGAGSPVRMMSFSSLAVHRMHQLAPEIPLVHLIEYRLPLAVLGSLPAGAAIGVDIRLLREYPRYVARLAGRRPVHVWTVDEPDDVRRCVDVGAEAIITNRPADVVDQLARLSPAPA